ncbi:YtxH domain-containing protein [Candidatus Gottesmanbacteria bacterium]|nr:YtxH domain-containing protein [Candidatus Gottesmanbacteria bacterium]
MNENRNNGGLLTGLILGAALGAGITLLLTTSKGKEIRKKVKDNYPEFFDQVDEVLGNDKENSSEKSSPRHRFVKAGRKL